MEDLGQALEMAPSAVRRKLAFWQGQGLVKEEETDVFVLVEERRTGPQEVIAADDDDEMESAMASAAQQREQEMQVCPPVSVEGGNVRMPLSVEEGNICLSSVEGSLSVEGGDVCLSLSVEGGNRKDVCGRGEQKRRLYLWKRGTEKTYVSVEGGTEKMSVCVLSLIHI